MQPNMAATLWVANSCSRSRNDRNEIHADRARTTLAINSGSLLLLNGALLAFPERVCRVDELRLRGIEQPKFLRFAMSKLKRRIYRHEL